MSAYSRWSICGLAVVLFSAVLDQIAGAQSLVGDDAFADIVVSYDEGSNPAGGLTTPSTAVGPPERDSGEGIAPGVVSVFQAAWRPDEIVSVGAGGHLVLQFNTPVTDDPNNVYGVDLLIFGNNFFLDTSFPDGNCGSPCTDAGEGGEVAVSADGKTWFVVDGAMADGGFPTQGYTDVGPYDVESGSSHTRFTQPVDPAIATVLDGADYAEILALYNGAGGGMPVDLASVGLPAVSYVRISNPVGAFGSPEIDAVADVSPRTPGDVNLDDGVDVNDLLALLAGWGPVAPGDPPADFNLDGAVDVLDLLTLLGNWS